MPKSFLCCERAFCRSKMGQVRHCLWPDRNLKFAGPHCLWPDRTIKFAGPHCLRPDRNIKFAGPHCLWPDREAHLRAPRRTSLPMAGPDTRFGTYKVSEWREGVQPQKTWIQKTIWNPHSSSFSSPMAGGGAAAENLDTENNLEPAFFVLFISHGSCPKGVQPQKTWIQKTIWNPHSSSFSSPTSIVCQVLVQTG